MHATEGVHYVAGLWTFTNMTTKGRKSAVQRTNTRNGLLFVMPALIGLAMFTVYPVVSLILFSFCRYTALKPPTWVGPSNYTALMHDKLFFESLYNTAYYTVFAVPLGIIVAFALAVLLNAKVKGLAFFRTIFYLPSIVPVVASSVLWLWILNPDYGLINVALSHLGIAGPGWLADPNWSKPALILMSTWGIGATTVIYLAGLQDVPQELYEAAEIDGATGWHKTRHITIPFMSPYIFFTGVMGIIGSTQYFTQAWVMTGGTGGPANSTMFFAMYLFQNAFQMFKMGYACAMAWLLFIVILLATLLIFRSSARYVYYGGK
ncbi:MAG: sugar ABC transporter permease [Armatimonadetes bacterium]|nr:sugar ABC transporter permease [Armatimonadota bacterium]